MYYRADLEANKDIGNKEALIEFYKKISELCGFVDEINYKYYKENERDAVEGQIVLNKNTFYSLYKSAAEINWGNNSDFYQGRAKQYGINFSVTYWKKTKKLDITIEDIAAEFYRHHSTRTVFYLKKFFGWLRNDKLLFCVPYYTICICLNRPKFLKRNCEIRLPFAAIQFGESKRFDVIDKFVEENNKTFIEFIKKVIALYDADKCAGRHYSDASGDGILIFDYSKANGFKIYRQNLP